MDIHSQRIGGGTGISNSHHRLVDVPPDDVRHIKGQIEHWINDASNSSATFYPQDVWNAIENKSAQLWLAWSDKPDAVCVTQLNETPKGKQCCIWIMVGSSMVDWLPLIDQLEAWAKREGCTMMRHEARAGWSKILKSNGYKMPHVILEKGL